MVLLTNKALLPSFIRASIATISSLIAFALLWGPTKLGWGSEDLSLMNGVVVIATVSVFAITFFATLFYPRMNRLILVLVVAAIGSASTGFFLGFGSVQNIQGIFDGFLRALFLGGVSIVAGFGAAYPLILVAAILFYLLDVLLDKIWFRS